MGFDRIGFGSFLSPYMAMAVSSGNGPRKPVYATEENWKAKIRDSIAGEVPNGRTVDLWIYFHPRKGDVLESIVGSDPKSVKRRPQGTGLVRIVYHPESNLLLVSGPPQICEDGRVIPIDSERQIRAFSDEVLSIIRKINRTPL